MPLWNEECPIETLTLPERGDATDEQYEHIKTTVLADALKEFFDENVFQAEFPTPCVSPAAGLVTDLLIGAINSIDWYRIAEFWVDYVKWTQETETEEV